MLASTRRAISRAACCASTVGRGHPAEVLQLTWMLPAGVPCCDRCVSARATVIACSRSTMVLGGGHEPANENTLNPLWMRVLRNKRMAALHATLSSSRSSVGISTCRTYIGRRLLGLHRADPSTPLDKSAVLINCPTRIYVRLSTLSRS